MNRAMTKINAVLIVLIVLFAAVAAYGWLRPVEVKTETETITLEDLAKREGEVTVYGTPDAPDVEKWIIPAFKKVYPWAKVNYLGLAPGEVQSRIVSEYKAGKVNCDVMCAQSYPNHYLMAKEGALTTYTLTMYDIMAYPDSFKDPKSLSLPFMMLPIAIAYNTELVTPNELPKSYQDLADAKWNGKLVLDAPSTLNCAGPLFIHLYPTLGNASWTLLMDQMADNAIITESSSDSYQKIILGEAKIGPIFLNDYIAGKKQPTPPPLEIVWLEPATVIAVNLALPTNNPHPAMAKLFMEWIVGVGGQLSLADTGRPPAHPLIASSTVFAGVVPSDVELTPAGSNNPDYYENPSKWADILKDIFG